MFRRTISNRMTSLKLPISALPLPPASQLITHKLTADPNTSSVTNFRQSVLTNKPSLQRRARLLSPESHFSYVTPLPLPFPYDVQPPDPSDEVVKDKAAYIEHWLAAREAVHTLPSPSEDQPEVKKNDSSLRIYYSRNGDQPRELIGLSDRGLADCFPQLDVGDAFAVIGTPTLANSFSEQGEGSESENPAEVAARRELVDVLSGHVTLMSPEDKTPEFAPWSLRYSGHQFGSWAGQLGDGRAISILVSPHPEIPGLNYELQLKGAGRTPFSRSADGLAVLRSSIREYLCSEAMHALGIPTTRSLSLISLPALPVQRERVETACIMSRVAPSFIRIGSFEALNGPTEMFFFGGGQQKPDWEALRTLGEWVTQQVLKLGGDTGEAWGKRLVLEVTRRNARMVAGWQAYGFMHGVINTDNVSILGLTLDYGPYSFMDVFDPFHICNHTDDGGRYAYRYQPGMIVYALRALLNALSPIIGAEDERGNKAVGSGWAANADDTKIAAWKKRGLELVSDDLERIAQEVTSVEYGRLMRKRLGLRRQLDTDEVTLFRPLLEMMDQHKLDFHSTFRSLAFFKPGHLGEREEPGHTRDAELEALISELISHTPEPERTDHAAATTAWMSWLDKYAQRIEEEHSEWVQDGSGEDVGAMREREMKDANPRFVLRQWVLEEVIAKVEKDADSGKRVLAKVMKMASSPFEPWGGERDDRNEEELSEEEKEEREYCGMGEKRLLGFQCSCSS